MYNIQLELELNKHDTTDQVSVWVKTSDEEGNETEIVYIFSDLFRRSYMENKEDMLNFVNETKEALVEKIDFLIKRKKHTIFDYPRHRIIFQRNISNLNPNSTIGTTGDLNLDKNIPTMAFQNPENFRTYLISSNDHDHTLI